MVWREVRPVRGLPVIRSMPLRGIMGSQPHLFCSHLLEDVASSCTSTLSYCFATGPNGAAGPKDHGLKPSRTTSQNKPSLHQVNDLQYFVARES